MEHLMPDEPSVTARDQLNFERYRTRLGFWQAIWGTLISGGIAVAIPAAVDAYKARIELQLKSKEIEGKILDSHQQYISNFLNTALNQDIELRIRFSEYFSFVSDAQNRVGWNLYRESLVTRRDAIRGEINSKEMQLEQLRARRNSLTAPEQSNLAKLERELSWSYAEVGYVRRDSNVTAPAATAAVALDKASIVNDSETLFKDVVVDRNRLSQVNRVVDRIVAAKEQYEPVETATGI